MPVLFSSDFTDVFFHYTEAVYSDQYTGTDKKGSGSHKYIQRLPYYVLVKRIFGERDETNKELSEQLEIVKRRCVLIR